MDNPTLMILIGLAGTALIPLLTAAAEPAADADLPAGVRESDLTTKPLAGLGKKTELRLGDALVGERRYYDDDTHVFTESRLRDGALHGPQRVWYRDGTLQRLVTYRAGVVDGLAQSWDRSGKLLWESTLAGGSGVLKTFYPDGGVESECPYKGGLMHGVSRRWIPGGVLSEDTAYESGRKDGWSRYYFPNGTLKQEAFYRGDKIHGVLRMWNESGDLVNTYGLAAKDTPADYSDKEETPHYYVDGERVSKPAYDKAAASDPDLRRALTPGR